jgi:integrase
MASLIHERNGLRRIDVVCPDGKRMKIRLGRCSAKYGEAFKLRVERLVTWKLLGDAPDDETSRWAARLGEKIHERLAVAGLLQPRRNRAGTLKTLLDQFFESIDVKPITALGYQPTRNALIEQFGASMRIIEISPLDADRWRQKMKADGLAEATISKRVKLARQIFRRAVRWKMLSENPFADVKAGSQMNKSRQQFINVKDAQKVLDACPDAEWRLLFALSRYGGLRCPSEHLALRWGDVDWAQERFRVTCTKTEHHEGRGERWVPIFPELRPYLLEVFEAAEPGAEYVITRYRDRNSNLRTQLRRIIRKAGLMAWPRLFHNLRATRQTELAESFPGHVVCAWIGNTERVAQNHYLQVMMDHFARATKTAQNPAQSVAESARGESQSIGIGKANRPVLPSDSSHCESMQDFAIAATGLEPVTRGL